MDVQLLQQRFQKLSQENNNIQFQLDRLAEQRAQLEATLAKNQGRMDELRELWELETGQKAAPSGEPPAA